MLATQDIQRLARTLRRICVPLRERDAAGERLWYQGGEPYFDVFIDLDVAGDVRWFQLTLRGRAVTWDAQRRRLETALTNELALEDSAWMPASKMLVPSASLAEHFVRDVKDLLAARPDEPAFQPVVAVLERHLSAPLNPSTSHA